MTLQHLIHGNLIHLTKTMAKSFFFYVLTYTYILIYIQTYSCVLALTNNIQIIIIDRNIHTYMHLYTCLYLQIQNKRNSLSAQRIQNLPSALSSLIVLAHIYFILFLPCYFHKINLL